MVEKIKTVLRNSKCDGMIYLIEKLSDISGFFTTNKKLLYVVANEERNEPQNISTEFLRLNTNIEILSVENNQEFKSGRYNILEFICPDSGYVDSEIESFISLCCAHTKYMEAKGFVRFFYSLINIFQSGKEQHYRNLIGLWGELEFIRFFYHATGVDLSLVWHLNGSYDKYEFSLKNCNIEVKTTKSGDKQVTIKHSQLFNEDQNYLASVYIEEVSCGQTLSELIKEMMDDPNYCKNYNFILNIEKERKRVSPIEAETLRFVKRDICLYAANDINYLGNIPDQISEIVYKLDLSTIIPISFDEFIKFEIKNGEI